MMCSVLALKIASTGATGQGCSRTSSASGARRFGGTLQTDALGERRQQRRHLARLPGELRQVRGEVHGVLSGAAADLEHACGCAANSLPQHLEDRPLVAFAGFGRGRAWRGVCDNARMQAIDLLLHAPLGARAHRARPGCRRRSSSSSPAPRARRITAGCARGASWSCAARRARAFGDAARRAPAAHAPAARARRRSQRERQKAFRAPLIVVVAAHCDPAVKIPVIEQLLSAAAAAQAMHAGGGRARLQRHVEDRRGGLRRHGQSWRWASRRAMPSSASCTSAREVAPAPPAAAARMARPGARLGASALERAEASAFCAEAEAAGTSAQLRWRCPRAAAQRCRMMRAFRIHLKVPTL